MTIIFNNTEMNISQTILDLEHERSELIINYSKTKERVKEINTQIKKLRTISKHAEEVLGTKVEENGAEQLKGLLKF